MKFLPSLICLFLLNGEPLLAITSELPREYPQTNLAKAEIEIGNKVLEVPLATTPEEWAKGLMYRTSLGENEGMLFVFDDPQQVSFWMKNTLVPLSVAYINTLGIILEIYDMEALSEKPVPSIFSSILYALEMPRGWFKKNGIQPGMIVQGLPRN